MSKITLKAIDTLESDGHGIRLESVESALDYVFERFESDTAQNKEIWAVTYNALAEAADSGAPAAIEAARERLVQTIGHFQRVAA
ncbi:hypothetical protein JCM19000A_41360 [Silvimonas sp. JCM 19000]